MKISKFAVIIGVSLMLAGCQDTGTVSNLSSNNRAASSESVQSSPVMISSDTVSDDVVSDDTVSDDAASNNTVSNAPAVSSESIARSSNPVDSSAVQVPAHASEFQACSIRTPSGTLQYWLYIPTGAASNMPLIVYLHGGSGKGNDLSLLTADGFPQYLQSGALGNVRAYVVMPQLSNDRKGWSDAAEDVYRLIQVTVSKFEVDTAHVALTGHSMGGTGTWSLAAALPHTFSRIAPLSGSVRMTDALIAQLKSTPVRAFVGDADTIVPPESSEAFVAALRQAGGDAQVIRLAGADHFAVPERVYLDQSIGLIDWLIG